MPLQEAQQTFLKQALPFWKELRPSQQQRLLDTASYHIYSKGELLHRGASDCAGLFLIERGQVRTYLLADSGREITLFRLLDWDLCLFSASCILHNIQFEVYMQAEKETAAILIPSGVYQDLMKESLPVADYTNQLMASRFTDVMWIMEQVLFMSLDQRLALFLLEQAELEGSDRLHMTHEEMANHLGSAREVISRMLKYFQGEGLVSLFRGGVELVNRAGLEQIAHRRKAP